MVQTWWDAGFVQKKTLLKKVSVIDEKGHLRIQTLNYELNSCQLYIILGEAILHS